MLYFIIMTWNLDKIQRTVKMDATMSRHMDETIEEITTLIGHKVYSNSGVFVGEVEDLRVDLKDRREITGLALTQLNDELFSDRVEPGTGVIVPYRWVRSVGDIVLVTDVVERLKDDEDDEDGNTVVA
jgi:sporulation protein YlmC with PRC-barrel domain